MTSTSSASIDRLRDVFLRNGERVFLIDAGSGTVFTYRELEQVSLRLASFLYEFGLTKGDRVACILPNSIEGSFLYFACMQIGAVIVPINQRLRAEEIGTLLEEAAPKVVFTTPFLLQEKGSMSAPLRKAREAVPWRLGSMASASQNRASARGLGRLVQPAGRAQ